MQSHLLAYCCFKSLQQCIELCPSELHVVDVNKATCTRLTFTVVRVVAAIIIVSSQSHPCIKQSTLLIQLMYKAYSYNITKFKGNWSILLF